MATPQPTTSLKPKKKLFQRRIPTLLGIAVLLIALVGGIVVMGNGGVGVFAPRATPQTTPKKIHVTNVTDTSFTVSFFTDEATTGFIKYGTEEGDIKSQASDDRDQLSGSISEYNLHHITVRGLEPKKTYYYVLGTSSGSQFDNSGTPFTTVTAARGGVPPAARTIYGSVVAATGNPAEGSVVYVTIPGAGELSSLVKSSGSWAVPLSTARTPDGSSYAEMTDESQVTILAQGGSANLISQVTTTVGAAQPVNTITLGESSNTTAQTTETTASESAIANTDDAAIVDLETDVASSDSADTVAQRGGLNDLLSSTSSSDSADASESAIVDLVAAAETPNEIPVVTTTQPTITGTAAPNVVVTIEVHSETNIQVQLTTDANGQFVLDIAKMSETLEPGPHTVTYSYVDPTTGQTVTKTQSFTVAPRDTGSQIAAVTASPSPTPYGSGNPYPIGGATESSKTSTSSSTTSTSSSRVSVPSTSSGVPVSGSAQTTLALVIGGLFFMIAGIWSYWIAQQLEEQVA